MSWLAWRQHRLALAGFAVLFLGVIVLYWLADPLGADAPTVYNSAQGFSRLVKFGEDVMSFFQPIPVLVGVFTGAPLVSRELEHGTHRFAWTQGCSRGHWLLSKVVLVGGAVVVLSALAAAVHAAWFAPEAAARGWFALFNQTVLVFPVTCLFTFGLGVALGALIKRTVPAMAATVVAAWAVLLVVARLLRPNYQEPVTATQPFASRDAPPGLATGYYVDGEVNGDLATYTYHPADRFWTFQFIETGLYLALTAALLALVFWWLRRRTS
ncbi:ABC transporter permease subunit [Saccharopolyspora sp. NPDC000359]|uniref:ABC transporter permease subunit n=1 Tax=Saccharopolyspora sp. NPDC000359 TaxID=3154251 RepID=UPI00331C3944